MDIFKLNGMWDFIPSSNVTETKKEKLQNSKCENTEIPGIENNDYIHIIILLCMVPISRDCALNRKHATSPESIVFANINLNNMAANKIFEKNNLN